MTIKRFNWEGRIDKNVEDESKQCCYILVYATPGKPRKWKEAYEGFKTLFQTMFSLGSFSGMQILTEVLCTLPCTDVFFIVVILFLNKPFYLSDWRVHYVPKHEVWL